MSMASEHHHHHDAPVAGAAIDPVCGMTVDPHAGKPRADYQGQTYHFCCNGCRGKFLADPQKYLGQREPEPVVQGATYTCPMHPEIRQIGPGACPICGMALEPEIATAEAGPNPELADMTRRFWIGLVLALPVMVLEMGGHFAGPHNWVDPTLSNTIQFAFATPVVLWAGWPFFVRGAQSLVTRNLNMFTLIGMGTGVAYVYSVHCHLRARHFSGRLPRSWRRAGGLFRSRQHDHRAGADRPGARTARARSDFRCDPRLARSRAQDRAPRQGRRQRCGSPARGRRGRR